MDVPTLTRLLAYLVFFVLIVVVTLFQYYKRQFKGYRFKHVLKPTEHSLILLKLTGQQKQQA